jgi:epoxyqueuosine reductase
LRLTGKDKSVSINSHADLPLHTSLDIKAEAFSLGFGLCGIIRPQPPVHFDTYKNWLNLGLHAGMVYLATERGFTYRQDPTLLLPSCQSIIVVAAFYPENKPDPDPIRGNIAAYALSKDYHFTLIELLEQFQRRIVAVIGKPFHSAAYTDSAPILERDLAWGAGLGWVGKNANLISPRLGSFFLLAELFTDLLLEPDPPFLYDRCGSCTRCIQACPTKCILPDRTIDSNRCISYLTIENKGAIPAPLRPFMGQQVFGCDICQTVCPWNNKKPAQPLLASINACPELANPILTDELWLSEIGFKEKYKNTPLLRAKRRGYLRNVCVALGNAAQEQAVPALSAVLENEPEGLIRSHAAWALGQFHTRQSIDLLNQALHRENDPAVKEELLAALT